MLESLTTEKSNLQTINLDTMNTYDILSIMNDEDTSVPTVIRGQISQIERLVKRVISSFQAGGRLIYVGAGTSGRLGILDAAECPPTFSTPPELVQGLIAGGTSAIQVAVEGAEDNEAMGRQDLQALTITSKDTIVGIAASGRTPYVVGAMRYANEIGAATGSISCNKDAAISEYADIAIEVVTGPEVLTGSTRLKAGTAQKLVLNMISTASMIGIGKVYKNLMVDMKPTNQKLIERSKRIIMDATEADYETASRTFDESGQHVKTAIVMILANCDAASARKKLAEHGGWIRKSVHTK
ncbi:N-acetylmuramic acid 6-phosphate etherase [Neobacillus bataviensis]|uniref:N-acetylmuramic acid 6-phosphate etherase n=1 Tax=Neobacillus bataviensis TaxID=220685 RepID=UPI001CBD9573|nr:N-acetylmuramic acid 6-phosphate etherase [Neobacillus bataviensis]